MLQDSSIRKSLDEYVKRRIKEIPTEIKQTFPNIKQIWKCDNPVDFLYGYYVGKIEDRRRRGRTCIAWDTSTLRACHWQSPQGRSSQWAVVADHQRKLTR